jgi:NAD(P)H-hydrate epimerase
MQDVSKLPQLPPRVAVSHKGTYGRVLVVGGSRGMAGAPALVGRAALRSGAGLVTLGVPRSIQATVARFEMSYMTLGLGDASADALAASQHDALLAAAAPMSAVALGPGLGTDRSTQQLVCALYPTLAKPMVVDADALGALAQDSHRWEAPAGARILTPHAGEFQRLTGQAPGDAVEERVASAVALAQRDPSGQTVVVLKGHQTVIANSAQYAVNATGNPGMATGGSGDCLTGVIVALVAQGLSPWEAARLGVHVHGLAGDLAAEQLGQVSLIASDLVDYLPAAFQQLV